jgi:poly-beta-1,6-N-acetyl-D-glucosamine synthase
MYWLVGRRESAGAPNRPVSIMIPFKKDYILVTAAYNEGAYIESLIKSIVAQTVPPIRWVIVSDASTDRTDEIVQRYADQYPFIELLRIGDDHPRNFAAQVYAINSGFARVKETEFDFIGNVDADVTFEPTYFSDLLNQFADDPGLGLAGGSICEEQDGIFVPRPLNSPHSVAHAVQLFRRECFEDLGGYPALPHGGPDWYAVVRSRMNGWQVRSILQLRVFHHRPTGGAAGWIRSALRQGRMDYSLGSHPLFEMARLARRLRSRPVILYAALRLGGFLSCYCTGEKRMVSRDFIAFLRQEEIERLRQLWPIRSA